MVTIEITPVGNDFQRKRASKFSRLLISTPHPTLIRLDGFFPGPQAEQQSPAAYAAPHYY
jgi:hypothetical protein